MLPCFPYICFCADDPNNDPNISGDPYKTLFIARLVSNIFGYRIGFPHAILCIC